MFALVINKLKTIPRRSLFFYGLLIITMFGVVFKILTPNQSDQSLGQNYDGTLTRFSEVVFRGQSIKPPKNVPSYRSVKWIDQNTLQNQLLNSFVVEVDETEPTIWRNDTVAITKIADPTRFIVLNNNIRFDSKNQEKKSAEIQNNYKNIAAQWVNEHLPNNNLTIDTQSVRFLSGRDEAVATTEGLAEIIEIPFAQTVSGYSIRSEVGGGYPLYLWFSATSQEVIKAEFYPLLLEFEEPMLAEPISVDEAVARINSEKDARVVYAEQNTEQPFVLDQIKRGELNKVTLEYRINTSQSLVPFYRFDGNFVDRNDVQIFAEVVVPAI